MKKRDFACLWSLVAFVIGLAPAYAETAGSLDTTFGRNGVTTTSGVSGGFVNSILLQSDGKILVFAGNAAVLRYTASGALDPTFGSNGIATLSTAVSGGLALQANGQIVIGGVVTPSSGGAELGVERLNPNGTPDTSIGSDGLSVVSLGRSPNVGTAVLVDPNTGNILTCTTLIRASRGQPYQTALARFNSSGGLDTSFGNQGLSIQTGVHGCTALALLTSGDILVVNTTAVAQFTSSGGVRSTVTGGTVVATSQTSAVSEPSIFAANGDFLFGRQLFIGGQSRAHNSSAEVLRFNQTGTELFDSAFHYTGAGGIGIEALVDGLAIAPNGDIIVAGAQRTFAQSGIITIYGVARLTANGVLDPNFGNGGTVVNNIPATSGVVVQPDGNIVTVGFASDSTTLTLARYLGN